MRFMIFVKMREDVGTPPPALPEAMEKEMRALFTAGTMLEAGGLGPSRESAHLELRGGDVMVTNGTWTEATEVAGGFAVMELQSLEDAVEHGRQLLQIQKDHWPGWEGSVEVRPLHAA